MTIKIHAPFYVRGWQWHTWTAHTSNTHAACLDKANELGATMWDTSQASVMIDGTVTAGHPTVLA
jgi:hypothetical protein